MKTGLATAAVIWLWVATPAFAHRLDEYLQAATFVVASDLVAVHVRLTPGVEVFGKVLEAIDTNRDGVISETEQRA
jgi:hypothetical protein